MARVRATNRKAIDEKRRLAIWSIALGFGGPFFSAVTFYWISAVIYYLPIIHPGRYLNPGEVFAMIYYLVTSSGRFLTPVEDSALLLFSFSPQIVSVVVGIVSLRRKAANKAKGPSIVLAISGIAVSAGVSPWWGVMVWKITGLFLAG